MEISNSVCSPITRYICFGLTVLYAPLPVEKVYVELNSSVHHSSLEVDGLGVLRSVRKQGQFGIPAFCTRQSLDLGNVVDFINLSWREGQFCQSFTHPASSHLWSIRSYSVPPKLKSIRKHLALLYKKCSEYWILDVTNGALQYILMQAHLATL